MNRPNGGGIPQNTYGALATALGSPARIGVYSQEGSVFGGRFFRIDLGVNPGAGRYSAAVGAYFFYVSTGNAARAFADPSILSGDEGALLIQQLSNSADEFIVAVLIHELAHAGRLLEDPSRGGGEADHNEEIVADSAAIMLLSYLHEVPEAAAQLQACREEL